MRISFKFIIIFILLSVFFSCDKKTDNKILVKEEEILERFSESSEITYNEYLVAKEKYTTRGAEYQERYHRHLIGVASELTENKNLIIEKGTVGFYYDKKSNNLNRLYLGLDIDSGKRYLTDYSKDLIELMSDNLKDVVDTLQSCRTIFLEQEVVGLVIGWKWKKLTGEEHVNIWINKDDVIKFVENQLTFDELLHKSTATNSDGKIIRLPI